MTNRANKLKVFISYSRRDASDFADEIVAGLELAGFEPKIDKCDITPGEDWISRLGNLILSADTMVFVISPGAVSSTRCNWEIGHAFALGKRILPITLKAVPDNDIPLELRRLQFIRFDGDTGINRPLLKLAAALREDLDWIREHTRLGEQAARWEEKNKSEALFLRGEELVAAMKWATLRKITAPEITTLQHQFISASHSTERKLREEHEKLVKTAEYAHQPLAEIGKSLPFLRGFARALTGSQPVGDAQVIRVLERFVEQVHTLESRLQIRHWLYRGILSDPQNAGVPHFMRALMLESYGFSYLGIAEILGIFTNDAVSLLEKANREIGLIPPHDVLIIEDEKFTADDLQILVKSFRHNVIAIARTRDEAIAAARNKAPQLILADVALDDGSSGVDAVVEITKICRCQVIYITSYPEQLLTGERSEPAFLVTKPFDPKYIKSIIAQALSCPLYRSYP